MTITGFFAVQNPETIRRLKRFRSRRLARFSLWILAALYLISLGAELVCNSDPLYLRLEGQSYFPVFRYYPEDAFLGNGKQTRPDYKKMAALPLFADNPRNIMIFPLLSYGPYESVSPSDLAADRMVTLELYPMLRMATVNLRPDGTISRSASFGTFADLPEPEIWGRPIRDFLTLPDAVTHAVAGRFENRAEDAFETRLAFANGRRAVLELPAYAPRSTPPKSVRLTLREEGTIGDDPVRIRFDKTLAIKGSPPELWRSLDDDTRKKLTDRLSMRFDRPVDALFLDIGKGFYRAEFDKKDIRFPHPPTGRHLLGLDEAGRDVLARILYGLRISLTFGLVLVVSSMALGIGAGAVQGYYGGTVDITAQRLIEIWSALPFLYVMILMGSVYGRSFGLLLVCYGIFNWIGISYYVRAEFLRLRKQPFVEAAKCLGISSFKIIFKHILPNAMVPVITFFPFSLVGAIGSLAALDYLGFGLPPPTPSWGELLAQAQQYRWAWWLIVYPSLALFIVMLLGVFIGEGVRNAYDPKRYARLE
ncbi:hypothetical protein JCM14469_37250 [Desulfatiferula olefinivorans]